MDAWPLAAQRQTGADREEAANELHWDQQEAYERQIYQRQAQAAADERRRFERKWLAYAVQRKPRNGPDDFAATVQTEVMAVLTELQPDEDRYTVERLIEAAISRALTPWRSAQERSKSIEDSLDALPWSMRMDNNWKARSRIAAAAAVANARPDASPEELKAIAQEAVRPLIQQYQHNDRVEEGVRHLFLPGTTDEDQEAREAARIALSALPIDASPRQFEQAKQNAIEPIRSRIEARIQSQRQSQEAERQRQEAQRQREWVLSVASWRLPSGISDDDRKDAIQEIQEALSELPADATQRDIEKARDEVIKQYEEDYQEKARRAEKKAEQARKKANLVRYGLTQIRPCAERLLRQFDYDPGETAWSIDSRVRNEVRKTLEEELTGAEAEQEVARIVRQVMGEVEGCE